MATPEISVVLCAYNAEKYIDEAILSIKNQTYTSFEAIIINDGSTDRTAEIIERHGATDDRFKYVTTKNQGEAMSRNLGNGMALGGLIANIDADDAMLPERLERQIAAFRARPKLGLLGSSYIEIDENSVRKGPVTLDTGNTLLRRVLWRRDPFCHGSIMIRKMCFEETGGYRPFFRYGPDYDMIMHVGEKWEIDNLPEPLYLYRVHSQNITTSLNENIRTLYSTFIVYSALQRKFVGKDDVETASNGWMSEILETLKSGNGLQELQMKKLKECYKFMGKSFLKLGDLSRARRFMKLSVTGMRVVHPHS